VAPVAPVAPVGPSGASWMSTGVVTTWLSSVDVTLAMPVTLFDVNVDFAMPWTVVLVAGPISPRPVA
jgi:hypothetical protein